MRPLSVTTSLVLALASALAHAQDAAAGGMAFQQCSECHSAGSADNAGPGLKGVFGRQAGQKPGFAFSAALKASGIVWDDRTLDAFLANPQKAVPGTAMVYGGDDDAKERADLVAYLKTLK
jgi:cytochrome c